METRTEEDKLVVSSFLRRRTEETFLPLFEAFYPRVRRIFLLRGLSISAADDLSQQVFLKVFRNAGELREEDRFWGWIYAIVHNELANYWRYQKSRIQETQLDEAMDEAGDCMLREPDMVPNLQVTEWLNKLEPFDRELLILRYDDGLSYKELATVLEMPIGTVKWRVSELRRKLSEIVYPPGSRAPDLPKADRCGAPAADEKNASLRAQETICDA